MLKWVSWEASRVMPYEIRYSTEAVDQLRAMRNFDRTTVLDQIEQVLAVNPTIVSKARVKRLREPASTQYRLRVGDFRVFYDVEKETVVIIQILSKLDSLRYLG